MQLWGDFATVPVAHQVQGDRKVGGGLGKERRGIQKKR